MTRKDEEPEKPARPDHDLPGRRPGAHPDQELPGHERPTPTRPGPGPHPDQELPRPGRPGDAPHPDQGLPEPPPPDPTAPSQPTPKMDSIRPV